MTKTKNFDVPVSAILGIAKILEENEIENQILGPSEEEDEAIVLEVSYEKEEREAIFELESAIEDAWEELEEEEEEDDDDDDE